MELFIKNKNYELIHGDCRVILPTIPDASIDCVITDPPYPEISRPYGRLTEAEWWSLMMDVCRETRRVLKPTGSAVFILQPNSRKVGSMRGWLFEFQAWACREWNMVQDAWWWNPVVLPSGGATTAGLMRASLKACVWLGRSDCYRDQDAILWGKGEYHRSEKAVLRAGVETMPSGHSVDVSRCFAAAERRGGVTPYNVLPLTNSRTDGDSAGDHGHGAGTPIGLADWWTRYICPPDGTILDPFAGSGTMGLAALRRGRRFVGIERFDEYYNISYDRLQLEIEKTSLFD